VAQFIEALLVGILIGGLYGLLSSGLSLIFGITRVVNFAHGDFLTIGMYGGVLLIAAAGFSPLVGLPVVTIATFALGVLTYLLLIAPTLRQKTIRKDDTHTSQIVITFALGILIQNVLLMVFGAGQRDVEVPWAGLIQIGSVYVGRPQVVAFAISVVCFLLLYLFLNRTRTGKAVRATVDDGDMAKMVGIATKRMYMLTFGLGMSLAGLAGVILVTYYPVTPTTGAAFLAIAFVSVVLGGLGSVTGALIAGIIVGVVQQLTAAYIAIDLQDIGLFVLFIAVLLFRPQGLLGSRVV
jgi:branched-chain amino acid transport system permease protein